MLLAIHRIHCGAPAGITTQVSGVDRADFQDAMNQVQEQQQSAARAKAEVDRLTRELQNTMLAQSTTLDEQGALEQRRSNSQANYWELLDSVVSVVLPFVVGIFRINEQEKNKQKQNKYKIFYS